MIAERELELDRETKEFVDSLGGSLLGFDVLTFYHANPFSLHTPHNLAVLLGRREDELATALDLLVEMKILARTSQGGDYPTIYSFAPADEIRGRIERLMDLSQGKTQWMYRFLKK